MFFKKDHTVHYLIIIGILLLAAGLLLLWPSKNLQLMVIIVTSLFYLFYGILHHRVEHDLTVKIVVEYVLVAVLVTVLFIFVKGGL